MVLFKGTIQWYFSVVLFNGTVQEYYSMVLLNGTIQEYYSMVLLNGTIQQNNSIVFNVELTSKKSNKQKAPGTRELKKELLSPHEQTQIQQLTMQAEVVEAENVKHDVAEEQQIRQQGS